MRLVILLVITHFFLVIGSPGQSKRQYAEEQYQLAQQEFRSGNVQEASDLINESLKWNQTPQSYYLQGLIYEAQEKDLRAVASYEAVLRLDPEYREAIFQKGLIYLQYGDPSQALKDFNRLIEGGRPSETRGVYFQVDPLGASQNQVVSMVTMQASLYNYRGQAYEKLGAYPEALEDYGQAIGLESDPDFLVNRALLYHRLDSLDKSISDLKQAILLDPNHQLAWYNLTLLDPSVELPNQLMQDESFAPTLGLLASRAMEAGRYEQAKKYFDQSLEGGEDALTYINRGRVLLKMEAYEEARLDFNRARRLEPMRIETLYLIGNSFFYQEEYASAIAYYDQYLTADPENGMVWLNGAMCYLEQKQYPEACHYLQRAETLGMTQAKSLSERYCD